MNGWKRFMLAVLCITATLHSADTNAQVFKRRQNKNEIAPPFILVQLPTGYKKIKLYTSKGNTRYATQAKTDADNIAQRIVIDFKDNFTYCPVYYYYDSNATAILQHSFNGVLLNNSMQTISDISFVVKDTTYQVVYFGYDVLPVAASNDKDDYAGTTAVPGNKQRLVVLDHRFNRIKAPAPNQSSSLFLKKNKQDNKTYTYRSPRFDANYNPYAKNLSAEMTAFYAK